MEVELEPVADASTGGYLNEHGKISLPRLQMLLDKLGDFEKENFEAEFADSNWYKGKQHKAIDAMEKARKKGKLGESRRYCASRRGPLTT